MDRGINATHGRQGKQYHAIAAHSRHNSNEVQQRSYHVSCAFVRHHRLQCPTMETSALFLGKILHRFIIVTVEIESVMFGRNIDLSSYIYAFLLTILFSLFVNGVMHFKLKKINMVESLKSVE